MSFPDISLSAMPPQTSFPKMTPPPRPMQHSLPDEPVLPETEERLRCSNRRRLFRCFRMASKSSWVAEWLFSQPTHPFHHHTTVPPASFENSLAFHALHTGNPPAPTSGPVSAGNDLLLVPVAHSNHFLIGYTFGGHATTLLFDCSFDNKQLPFFPHFVGRFAYDTRNNDLLIVINCLNECITGVISIHRGNGRIRERSIFAVAAGNYGYKRLPARILHMGHLPERRLASIPKYQFAVDTGNDSGAGGGGRGVVTDMSVLRQDLAKLERLVKGKFYAHQMLKDSMDAETGELRERVTAQVESSFDVMDAVGLRVFHDMAVRSYYSYMASVSESGSGGSSRQSGGETRSGSTSHRSGTSGSSGRR